MFGVIKTILSVGVKVLSLFKGGQKPSIGETLSFTLQQLIPAIENAIAYENLDSKEKFDNWLETFDKSTGSDQYAVDLIKGMPKQAEEEFFDGIKQAAKAYGYMKIGVEGYRE